MKIRSWSQKYADWLKALLEADGLTLIPGSVVIDDLSIRGSANGPRGIQTFHYSLPKKMRQR